MQGTLERRFGPYNWIRIGFATDAFRNSVVPLALLALIVLGACIYLELPETAWRLPALLAIYLVAGMIYLNPGVWLHEQLHCVAFHGALPAGRVRITYLRKHLVMLNGYYSVSGPLNYRIMSRALLGPLYATFGLVVVAVLGSLVLPGWWLPLMLSLAVISLLDMLHDFFMYSQVRRIGARGRYWDRGRFLEVVWKTAS